MSGAEIIIRVDQQQYLATLMVDGQVNRRAVLAKWPEIAVWAHQVQRELGEEIYAHLKNTPGSGVQTTLALARYLDAEGFIVGIETDWHRCPKGTLQLH